MTNDHTKQTQDDPAMTLATAIKAKYVVYADPYTLAEFIRQHNPPQPVNAELAETIRQHVARCGNCDGTGYVGQKFDREMGGVPCSYCGPLRAALFRADSAASHPVPATTNLTMSHVRRAWLSGFTLAVGYGDNWRKFEDAAEKESQWLKFCKAYGLDALSNVPATTKGLVEALGEPCRLDDCEPGLFMFDGMLGFKSEYGVDDVYVVGSGEEFWGGTSDKATRSRLIVRPILEHILESTLSAPPATNPANPEGTTFDHPGDATEMMPTQGGVTLPSEQDVQGWLSKNMGVFRGPSQAVLCFFDWLRSLPSPPPQSAVRTTVTSDRAFPSPIPCPNCGERFMAIQDDRPVCATCRHMLAPPTPQTAIEAAQPPQSAGKESAPSPKDGAVDLPGRYKDAARSLANFSAETQGAHEIPEFVRNAVELILDEQVADDSSPSKPAVELPSHLQVCKCGHRRAAHGRSGECFTQDDEDMFCPCKGFAPSATAAMGTPTEPKHVCGLTGFGALGDVCPACQKWREDYNRAWYETPSPSAPTPTREGTKGVQS